jgi:hypothetical protein
MRFSPFDFDVITTPEVPAPRPSPRDPVPGGSAKTDVPHGGEPGGSPATDNGEPAVGSSL